MIKASPAKTKFQEMLRPRDITSLGQPSFCSFEHSCASIHVGGTSVHPALEVLQLLLSLRLAKVCLLLQDDTGPTKLLQEGFELGADFGKLLALGGLGESGAGLYLKQGLLQVRVLGLKLFEEALCLGQQVLQLLLFRELEFDLHLTLLLELLELLVAQLSIQDQLL